MNSPSAVIAEDEPLVGAELRRLLVNVWPELIIREEVTDGLAAVAALDKHHPEILFLDIEMPGLNGLEVARRVSGQTQVVFITAFDQYAVAAFEKGAVDYVLKPVSAERLSTTVARLRQQLSRPPGNLGAAIEMIRRLVGPRSEHLKWLTVPRADELQVISVAEILYFRSDRKYTEVVTRRDKYLITGPLRYLRDRLDPEMFWQIHRSILINVTAIETVHRTFRGAFEIKVRGRSELLPVSSAYTHRFKLPPRGV
ncbi:MAG TPA: LytTR family DNA-binding domain-containing protein [Steroidobacteraceae bacterium]|nr:LytTR family DNA-binding domain-containing protein [Steroidobacteraceae bacterium]